MCSAFNDFKILLVVGKVSFPILLYVSGPTKNTEDVIVD
jgi:hypothetical protein